MINLNFKNLAFGLFTALFLNSVSLPVYASTFADFAGVVFADSSDDDSSDNGANVASRSSSPMAAVHNSDSSADDDSSSEGDASNAERTETSFLTQVFQHGTAFGITAPNIQEGSADSGYSNGFPDILPTTHSQALLQEPDDDSDSEDYGVISAHSLPVPWSDLESIMPPEAWTHINGLSDEDEIVTYIMNAGVSYVDENQTAWLPFQLETHDSERFLICVDPGSGQAYSTSQEDDSSDEDGDDEGE